MGAVLKPRCHAAAPLSSAPAGRADQGQLQALKGAFVCRRL